jgi:probable phosphomutase (TIGR03848 family)
MRKVVLSYLCEATQQEQRMTQFLLIRHAVNDVMKQKKLAGRMPEVHLNDEGRAQALALAERLQHLAIKAVYTSPLERTRETAAPLAQALGLEAQIREGLVEVEYGDWTGQPLEDLAKRDEWKIVQLFPSGMRFPGGESIREMQTRIVGELEAIAADHPRDIVAVVSHADVIKAVLAHYLGVHLDLFQRIVIEPTSVSVIGLSKFGPRVVRINDDGALKIEPEKEQTAEQQQVGGVSTDSAPPSTT